MLIKVTALDSCVKRKFTNLAKALEPAGVYGVEYELLPKHITLYGQDSMLPLYAAI